MERRTRLRRTLAASIAGAIVIGVLALALAGCGGSSSTTTGGNSGTSGTGTKASGSTSAAVIAHAKSVVATALKGDWTTPPTSGPKAQKGKTVWFVTLSQEGGAAVQAEGATAAAKLLGWHVHLCDGNDNANNGFQTCMSQALAAKPNGIIDMGIDCALIKAPLEQAKKEGIPVVGALAINCDQNLPQSAGPSLFVNMIPSKKYPTWSDYFRGQFVVAGNALIAHTNGKANTVNLAFDGNTEGAIGQTTLPQIYKTCSGCSLHTAVFGFNDLTEQALKSLYQGLLLKNPNANSSMIIDAQQVETGLEPIIEKQHFYSVTMGSNAELSSLLDNGSVNAVVSYDQAWIGWAAADTLNRVFAHASQAPEGLGIKLLTKQTVTPGYFKVPYDYQAVYQKVWTGS